MKELIEEIDNLLEQLEDSVHGELGNHITRIRHKLESLQSKGKTKSAEGSDVLSFLSNSKRQFAKECGCERCLEILSIHEREEYAQSHTNKDGWVSVDRDNLPKEEVLSFSRGEFLVGYLSATENYVNCNSDEITLFDISHYQILAQPQI